MTQTLDSIDVTAPELVEVMIRRDGKVVWVNVDGQCLFRACKIEVMELNDERLANSFSDTVAHHIKHGGVMEIGPGGSFKSLDEGKS